MWLALASLQARAQQPGPSGAPQGFNPDLSFVADFALAVFSADEPLQTGAHDPSRTGFVLQQLELSAGKAVDPYFRFDANLVFAPFGVEVEEVYATTLSMPARTQLRVGQFLTRIGRQNPTHPHAWDFADQPLALGRLFGGEGNRGLGVEASVLLPLPWYVEVVGSETEAAGEATARSFYGADDLGVDSPLHFQSTLALKQFFDLSASTALQWGLSAATGPNPTGRANRTDLYGTDLYLKYRPARKGSFAQLALQAEGFWRRRQVPGDLLQDANGYAQLVWRFRRHWGAGVREEYGSPAVGLDGAVVDPLDPDWTTARWRSSAALTFHPTEFSRVRLQGARDDTWREEADWSAFLAFEVVAGAHGSHPF